MKDELHVKATLTAHYEAHKLRWAGDDKCNVFREILRLAGRNFTGCPCRSEDGLQTLLELYRSDSAQETR